MYGFCLEAKTKTKKHHGTVPDDKMADTEADADLAAEHPDCIHAQEQTPVDEYIAHTDDNSKDDATTSSDDAINADVSFKIVAAIDFGTTFSGYAYSFADEKDKIYTNKNWGQTQGFLLHKTPTCLLLRPDGEFEAFGFEAVSKYNELTEEEADEFYYFDRFKMKLYDNKVRIA